MSLHHATQRRRFWKKLEGHHKRNIWRKEEESEAQFIPLSRLVENVKQKVVFTPEHSLKITWDLVIAVMVLYTLVAVPLQIGFFVALTDDTGKITLRDGLDILVDVMFGLDMCVNFNTGFIDVKSGTFVYSHKRIAARYLKSWFAIDFISTFPFDKIVDYASQESTESKAALADRLRFLKILRVVRISKLMKILKVVHAGRAKQLLGFLERDLAINPALLSIGPVFLQVAFVAHYLACLWNFATTVGLEINDNGGATWSTAYGANHLSVSEQYVTSLYWTVATMMAVGYGDIYAQNSLERGLSIVVQFFGALMFGLIIGAMSKVAYQADATALARKLHQEELSDYMRHRKIPRDLQQRVRAHFKFAHSYTTVFPDVLQAMREEMSQDLMYEMLSVAYGSTVAKIHLFSHCPDKGFISSMILAFEPVQLQAGEGIVYEKELLEYCFFIVKGAVEFYQEPPGVVETSHGKGAVMSTDTVFGIVLEGEHFGCLSLVLERPYPANVRASQLCDMVLLRKDAFAHINYLHSDETKLIRSTSKIQEEALVRAKAAWETEHNNGKKPGPDSKFMMSGMLLRRKDIRSIWPRADHNTANKSDGGAHLRTLVLHPVPGHEPRKRNNKLGSFLFHRHRPHGQKNTAPENPEVARTGSTVSQFLLAKRERGQNAAWELGAHPRKNYMFEENEESEDALLKRWIIFENHPYKIVWDIVIASMILWSCIVIPFRIGFSVEATGIFFVLDIFVDFCFAIDMLLSFRTTFYLVKHKCHVAVPDLIAKHYLRTWFVVDFLATFPLDKILLTLAFDSNNSASSTSARTLKLVRTVRLVRLAKIVKILSRSSFSEDIALFHVVPPAVINICKLLFEVWFVAHVISCFWYLFASFDPRGSWWLAAGLQQEPNSSHVSEHYLAALYWAFTTMTTVGYGDIVPSTHIERVYAIFVMILGATTFGYIAGSVAAMLDNVHVGKARRRAKIDNLKNFMRERHLPRAMMKNVDRYYSFYLGQQMMFDERYILSQLSPILRRQVLLCIHDEIIRDIFILKNQSPPFASFLVGEMRTMMFLPSDTIVHEGSVSYEMYFLLQGKAKSYNKDSVEFRRFKKGDILAHVSFLLGIRRPWGIAAVNPTRTSVLDKGMMQRMVKKRPEFAAQLLKLLKDSVKLRLSTQEQESVDSYISKAKKDHELHHHHHHHHHRRHLRASLMGISTWKTCHHQQHSNRFVVE